MCSIYDITIRFIKGCFQPAEYNWPNLCTFPTLPWIDHNVNVKSVQQIFVVSPLPTIEGPYKRNSEPVGSLFRGGCQQHLGVLQKRLCLCSATLMKMLMASMSLEAALYNEQGTDLFWYTNGLFTPHNQVIGLPVQHKYFIFLLTLCLSPFIFCPSIACLLFQGGGWDCPFDVIQFTRASK